MCTFGRGGLVFMAAAYLFPEASTVLPTLRPFVGMGP